jgi:hypothetical protein
MCVVLDDDPVLQGNHATGIMACCLLTGLVVTLVVAIPLSAGIPLVAGVLLISVLAFMGAFAGTLIGIMLAATLWFVGSFANQIGDGLSKRRSARRHKRV